MSATPSPADTILTRYTDRAAAIVAERISEQDATDNGWIDAEKRMRAGAASLITISRLAEDLAFQANAAKLLAPYAGEQAATHLRNARTIYAQLGEALGADGATTKGRVA